MEEKGVAEIGKEHKKIVNTIIEFISSEVESRKSKGVVVGISGGLDSAVATYLAVMALGPKKVFGLILPDSGVTPKRDITHAEDIAKHLGIKYKIIEVGKIKKLCLDKNLPQGSKLAKANLLVRLRMSLLYFYAAATNRLVLGTGDKSELRLGYFTKYGDGAADLFPIADLYKTEVRELAHFLSVPKNIANKKSSARLWKGHTAEGEIGMSYQEIDRILRELEKNHGKNYINGKSFEVSQAIITDRMLNKKKVKRLVDLIQRNKHKHEKPPICKLNRV
ncbi:MAG: NAD+ synthase [Thermoproteota archaeon]|jgi:NAD+ synthase|nr:NAD+ synthase [Thermoproteota archaeon]